jgi:hypothetical protein
MLIVEKDGPTVMSGRANEEPPDRGSGVSPQCAGGSGADEPVFSTDAKLFATARARCALAGWSLIEQQPTGEQPAYIATRWGMSRALPDLAAVDAFLAQIGVRP